MTKNCKACAHSYMEPDSELICGKPKDESRRKFGLIIRRDLEHCDGDLFEQHPMRYSNGTPKIVTKLKLVKGGK